MNKRNLLLGVLLIGGLPLVASAGDKYAKASDETTMRARMGEMKVQERFQKRVDDAADVYSTITTGAQGKVPASVLQSAQCIAVLPNVITGALIVGGTHGEGLVSCKNSPNTWSELAPISLNQGSFGFQAGAKSTDLVLFFRTKEAVRALQQGNFAIGSDVSAVAGSFDSSMDRTDAGIVAYSRIDGLFAGAALNGGKIGRDEDELAAYYGKQTDYASLLNGKVTPDASGYTRKLTDLFPKS